MTQIAANGMVRERLGTLGAELVAPALEYCTDNGVMIAWAGLEAYHSNLTSEGDLRPRVRWPLDQTSAPRF